MKDYKEYLHESNDVAKYFNVNIEQGLSSAESKIRLRKYGYNEITEKDKDTIWKNIIPVQRFYGFNIDRCYYSITIIRRIYGRDYYLNHRNFKCGIRFCSGISC